VKRLVERLRSVRARRDDGASAVEYGLLVALIAVVIALAIAGIGQALRTELHDACTDIATNDATCTQ
jgi:pilus assembly protein Flp/PilA